MPNKTKDSSPPRPQRDNPSEATRWLCEHGHTLLADGGPDTSKLRDWQKALLIQQMAYRGRTRRRFPDPAAWLWTDTSLAQASDWWSALYKAELFPGDELVVDACCGAGVDTVALATRGPVLGIDADADLAAIACSNLHHAEQGGRIPTNGSTARQGWVPEDLPGDAKWMHADPDRRPEYKKTLDASEFSPPLLDLLRASTAMAGAVIKVAPSTEFDETSEAMLGEAQRVWLGSYDDCRQQLLLLGEVKRETQYARGAAICAPGEAEFWGDETEEVQYVDEPLKYVYQLHSALHASELNQAWANSVGLQAVDDERGYYTSDEFVESPWVQAFEFQELLAWDDRKVRRWLRRARVANVEVKCRIVKIDANQYQRKYSKAEGEHDISLLITPVAGRVRALACKRIQTNGSP